ncbi:MAG: type II toxin-antitoxin system HipA family toxin [Alphaproteobacteria bacterium]
MTNKAEGVLNVYMNGRQVGDFRKQSSGALEFSYTAEWLNDGKGAISYSLPLRAEKYQGAVVNNYFENLLPDNDQIKSYLAAQTQAKGTDAFSLLKEIGADCVGALMFLDEGKKPSFVKKAVEINGTPISDTDISHILKNLKLAPLGMSDDEFRISIAGAQEKTGLLRYDDQWYRPIGATATTHIIKTQLGTLPNGIDLSDSVENEHFCLEFCKNLGFKVAETKIWNFDGIRALVVRRFDRLLAGSKLYRLPQEDMCQALSYPPNLKYQTDGGPSVHQIARLLNAANVPERDRLVLLKAQFVFWLLRATDGHAKNFSISFLPNGGFELSPLYDVLSAEPAYRNGQIQQNRTKLAMSIGQRNHWQFEKITKRHFLETATACGMDASCVESELQQMSRLTKDALKATKASVDDLVNFELAQQIAEGAQQRADEYLSF